MPFEFSDEFPLIPEHLGTRDLSRAGNCLPSSAAFARLDIATAVAPAAIAPRWKAMRSGVSSISMPTRSLGRTPASRKPAANWLTRAANAP
jgi:hypothetical protein